MDILDVTRVSFFAESVFPKVSDYASFRAKDYMLFCRSNHMNLQDSQETIHLIYKMTIYKLYIFNRHCSVVYYAAWNQQRPLSTTAVQSPSPAAEKTPSIPTVAHLANSTVQIVQNSAQTTLLNNDELEIRKKELEEDAKLVYGVVFSLKNIINKLSKEMLVFYGIQDSNN